MEKKIENNTQIANYLIPVVEIMAVVNGVNQTGCIK